MQIYSCLILKKRFYYKIIFCQVYIFYDLLTYYVRMYIMLIHIQHKMHHTYFDADNNFQRILL